MTELMQQIESLSAIDYPRMLSMDVYSVFIYRYLHMKIFKTSIPTFKKHR